MRKPTCVYLVRHGETAWNLEGRYQGHKDIELSPTGRKQAMLIGERLKRKKFAAIYSSDLRRARETASIIAGDPAVTVLEVATLRELNFGLWEGLTYKEVASLYPEELEQWLRDPVNTAVPGGESYSELETRVYNTFQEIVNRHPGDELLLVAHGGPLRVIICKILGLGTQGIWRFRIDNASISIVEAYEDGFILKCLNDTGHLEAEEERDFGSLSP